MSLTRRGFLKKLWLGGLAASCAGLAGCVTPNIYDAMSASARYNADNPNNDMNARQRAASRSLGYVLQDMGNRQHAERVAQNRGGQRKNWGPPKLERFEDGTWGYWENGSLINAKLENGIFYHMNDDLQWVRVPSNTLLIQ